MSEAETGELSGIDELAEIVRCCDHPVLLTWDFEGGEFMVESYYVWTHESGARGYGKTLLEAARNMAADVGR